MRSVHESRLPRRPDTPRARRIAVIAACGSLGFAWMTPLVEGIAQRAPAGSCRVSGRALATATPLPGVAVVVQSGDAVKAATSTDTDGTYRLTLPLGTYRVSAELMGFDRVARPLIVAAVVPCEQTVDFQLALSPRVPRTAADSSSAAVAGGRTRITSSRTTRSAARHSTVRPTNSVLDPTPSRRRTRGRLSA